MLEPAFEELLRSLTPSDEFMEIAALVTGKLWKKRVAEWDQSDRNIERQIEQIQTDVSRLVRRLSKASDAVAAEIEKEIELLKSQRAVLEAQLGRYRESPPDFELAFERVSTLFRNPHDYWKSGSEQKKGRWYIALCLPSRPHLTKKRGLAPMN